MSNWMKVLAACLAVLGGIMLISFVIGIFHYLVIGAVVLGLGYVILRAVNGPKLLSGTRKILP